MDACMDTLTCPFPTPTLLYTRFLSRWRLVYFTDLGFFLFFLFLFFSLCV